MRHTIAAITVLGFLAVSATAFATSPRQATPAPAKAASATHPASHAVRGVVKSVDDSSLVITHGKKNETLSFKLDPTTSREGTIAVGSMVSVHYRNEGKTLVATAVTPNTAKSEAHASSKSKK